MKIWDTKICPGVGALGCVSLAASLATVSFATPRFRPNLISNMFFNAQMSSFIHFTHLISPK